MTLHERNKIRRLIENSQLQFETGDYKIGSVLKKSFDSVLYNLRATSKKQTHKNVLALIKRLETVRDLLYDEMSLEIEKINAMREQGSTYQEIGNALGITRQAVFNIVKLKSPNNAHEQRP